MVLLHCIVCEEEICDSVPPSDTSKAMLTQQPLNTTCLFQSIYLVRSGTYTTLGEFRGFTAEAFSTAGP